MTLTNAQAALQAAATMAGGGQLYTSSALTKAAEFKAWLDQQDAEDLKAAKAARGPIRVDRDHAFPPLPSSGGHPDARPTPEELGMQPQTVVVTPRGAHHLVNDGGPKCHCGWNPMVEVSGGCMLPTETLRSFTREHIATEKEKALRG